MLYQTGNPHGGDRYGRPVALDFSANTNPLGTPEAVRRAVAESAACLDRYPDPYCRALVGALADYEQVPEKYLLRGCGAAELIFSYCAALRPRRALELAPTFSEYAAALTAAGCGVERHTLSRCTDFRLTEAVLPVLRQAAWDVVFLCNPNNPTGQLVEPGLLAEICRICREKEIRMFVDECFLDLSDPGRSASLKPLLAEQPGLFLLKAFTKSYGMAGLRLGYCLSADGALLRAMGRTVQPWNVSLPAQAAGVLIGKDLGRGDFDGAYRAAKKLLLYGFAASLCLSAVIVLIRPFYVEIYQVEDVVKTSTAQLLVAYALVAPFKVQNMILGSGILRSGGNTSYVMWIDLIGTWLFGVPLGLLSAFVFQWSIPLVYFTLSLEECVRFALSLWVLRRKRWMRTMEA